MKKITVLVLMIVLAFSALLSGCKKEARDISGDTPLASSVVYANSVANKVQGYYNGDSRTQYTLEMRR